MRSPIRGWCTNGRAAAVLALALGCLACGGPREVRTVDDVLRSTGDPFAQRGYWSANVRMSLTRRTHISEWDAAIYSDGARYAAVVNGAAQGNRAQSLQVIDAAGRGWLRITEKDDARVLTFDAAAILQRSGPAAFMLPGNFEIGMPLGMFLEPAKALRTLDQLYDLKKARQSHIDGDAVIVFRGLIRPEALAAIDPEGELAARDLPIGEIEVAIRLFDGAVKRVQFIENELGYLLIDYDNHAFNVEPKDTRFEFDPQGAEPVDVTDRAQTALAGVDDGHALFAWRETPLD